MARIFLDSFESQSLDSWDVVNGASLESTAGLDMKGSYCLKALSGSHYVQKYLPETNEYYFAFRFRLISVDVFYLIHLFHGGTRFLRVGMAGNKIHYGIDAGGGSTGSKALSINTTYFFQLYFKVANSGGRCLGRVDNVPDFDYTGDTQPGSDTTINRFQLGGYNLYFDNIVIDDSIMPEETNICLLRPNGIGNSSNWAPTSGDNYTCIDEVPYSDTDYVSEDVADAIDTYAVEDSPVDLVSVKCIQVQARTRKDVDSLLNNMNIVVRSDADYHGSDESLTTSFAKKIKIWEINPADSQVWEKADIDAMEIGVRARA